MKTSEVKIKPCKKILSFIGIILAVISFLVSHIKQIPCVTKIISPTYVAGMKGIKRLDANESLTPHDVGFSAIKDIIMSNITTTPPEDISQVIIPKIEPIGTHGLIDDGDYRGKMLVRAILTNGQDIRYLTGTLSKKLHERHLRSIFILSCWIFGIAILLQLPALFQRNK